MFQEKLSHVQLLKRQRDHPGKDQGTNVNNTANLSMLRHLTNPSMLPVSGIMDWQHQRHVSRCLHYPSPSQLLSIFYTFYYTFFCPLRGSWSQANVKGRLLLTQSKILIQVPFLIAKKVGL